MGGCPGEGPSSPREIYESRLAGFEYTSRESKLGKLLLDKFKRRVAEWGSSPEDKKGDVSFSFHDDPDVEIACEEDMKSSMVAGDMTKVLRIYDDFVWSLLISFKDYLRSLVSYPRGMTTNEIPGDLLRITRGYYDPVRRLGFNLKINERIRTQKTGADVRRDIQRTTQDGIEGLKS